MLAADACIGTDSDESDMVLDEVVAEAVAACHEAAQSGSRDAVRCSGRALAALLLGRGLAADSAAAAELCVLLVREALSLSGHVA